MIFVWEQQENVLQCSQEIRIYITYIKHFNDPHEDMHQNPNTTSRVTGNLKAGFICHPATPFLFQTTTVLISQVPQGN